MSSPAALEQFVASLQAGHTPPPYCTPALQALWHARKGDWDHAHQIAQDANSRDGDWVHAYLHRVEGDLGNAGYWYARAGRPRFQGTLEAEWDEIATSLLAKTD